METHNFAEGAFYVAINKSLPVQMVADESNRISTPKHIKVFYVVNPHR
jgi:hypothetical protein